MPKAWVKLCSQRIFMTDERCKNTKTIALLAPMPRYQIVRTEFMGPSMN